MQRGAVDAPQSKGFEIAPGCPATALILGLVEKQQKGEPAALSWDGEQDGPAARGVGSVDLISYGVDLFFCQG